MSTFLTHQEVSEHNTEKSLYMIIDKKVYDITQFLSEHPGGDEILLEEGAKDATEAFNDVGHSPDAVKLLEKFLIGEVDPNSKPVKVETPVTVNVSNKSQQGNPLRVILPIIFMAGYFYWRFFIKQ